MPLGGGCWSGRVSVLFLRDQRSCELREDRAVLRQGLPCQEPVSIPGKYVKRKTEAAGLRVMSHYLCPDGIDCWFLEELVVAGSFPAEHFVVYEITPRAQLVVFWMAKLWSAIDETRRWLKRLGDYLRSIQEPEERALSGTNPGGISYERG